MRNDEIKVGNNYSHPLSQLRCNLRMNFFSFVVDRMGYTSIEDWQLQTAIVLMASLLSWQLCKPREFGNSQTGEIRKGVTRATLALNSARELKHSDRNSSEL